MDALSCGYCNRGNHHKCEGRMLFTDKPCLCDCRHGRGLFKPLPPKEGAMKIIAADATHKFEEALSEVFTPDQIVTFQKVYEQSGKAKLTIEVTAVPKKRITLQDLFSLLEDVYYGGIAGHNNIEVRDRVWKMAQFIRAEVNKSHCGDGGSTVILEESD